MNELHSSHPGIVRMKALSRIHVWFPNIDRRIEEEVRSCHQCAQATKNPVKAYVHPWNWPTNPFDRVHIDFLGPFLGPFFGKNYLILVDSHSKWMEVQIMKQTDAFHTVATLRKWFAQFGMPIQLVSDNGPQFTFELFVEFMKSNGIKHIRTSAYHPSTNGGAERIVQTVKRGLKAAGIEKGDAEKKLQEYLIGYRSRPTTTTNETPSKLFLGRKIRTRLDLFKPDLKEQDRTKHPLQERMNSYERKMALLGQKGRQPVREFHPGEKVLVRNFPKKQKWISGYIVKKIAERTYIIDIGHREIQRHIDHIVKCSVEIPNENNHDEYMEIPDDEMNLPQPDNPQVGRQPIAYRKEYPGRTRQPVKRYGIDS